MKLAARLMGHRWGRIALHLRCCLRNGKVAWHWRGVCREWRATTYSGRPHWTVRHATWLIAMFMALRCSVASPSAYLVTVGPAPLRFQAPLEVKPKTVSSPLPQDEPAPDPSSAEPPAVTNGTAATNVTIVATPPATLTMTEPPAPSRQSYLSAVPSTNEVAITPQMVVEFFRSHTGANGNRDATVVVPYNFTPPMPTSKSSSSATYEAP